MRQKYTKKTKNFILKISFIVIGKTDTNYLSEGIGIYEKRVQKYTTFDLQCLSDLKNTANLSIAEQKEREGKNLLKCFTPTDWVVLLDEKGKTFSSTGFAVHLQQLFNRNVRHIKFVCGGAYGFSEAVYERANSLLSLSAMTFSHQLVRLVFMEQLYRAFTILNNEPYHHE